MIDISPSLMCADFSRLEQEVVALADAGADSFHLDVMDGSFVPNFAMGLHDIEAIRRATRLRLDAHLMVNEPERHIGLFAGLGCDRILVHVEATKHIHRVVSTIRAAGLGAGVVLNPGTPVSLIEEVIEDLAVVLLMAVNPGHAGQAFIEGTAAKAARLTELLNEHPAARVQVMSDGNVNCRTIPLLYRHGVTCFVAGTAGLFKKPYDYPRSIRELRRCVEREPVEV